MKVRDYTFLGTTQSLCPSCLRLVNAKIIVRGKRVYFRKHCETCGPREDFVCSDVDYYDRLEYTVPAKVPAVHGIEPDKGCPFDCGLCTEHEQHTCIGLVEVTSSCNLTCPMCYANSAPGGKHLSLELCKKAIDRLVEVEGGRAEVLQLSGGEPTVHPQLEQILEYAVSRPIDYIAINTNGLRFAKDDLLLDTVARFRDRVELFFQFDGFRPEIGQQLRGEDVTETKLLALERVSKSGIHCTLAATLQAGVNEDQIGPIIKYAAAHPTITAINFQPATYSGRHVLPEDLERRVTFPDVIKAAEEQTEGMFSRDDFMPLPCAHPNCHSLAYGFRYQGSIIPLTRFIKARENLDLLANGISFTRPAARNLLLKYLGSAGCCAGGCSTDSAGAEKLVSLTATGANAPSPAMTVDRAWLRQQTGDDAMTKAAGDFFDRVLSEQLGARDVFRVVITSFLDAYNFDVRRLMKCCTHHVLPSGHVIPFCAYNVLYREGHVVLPELARAGLAISPTHG
jgi:uncharacterized radical SAM superfamily Fe-S cluster-containing enzyme